MTLEYYSQDTHVLSAEYKVLKWSLTKKNLAKTEQHNYIVVVSKNILEQI